MVVGGFDQSVVLIQRAARGAGASPVTSLARLATGQRINGAADDPAGLIASDSLRATLSALDAETRSIERTNAVASVAGSALHEVANLLHEGSALALARANAGGLSDVERAANQLQRDSLI
jgi:flagellin